MAVDKELMKHIKETQRFMLDTMTKVRDGNLDVSRALAAIKGSGEMVKLGKLELDIEKFTKD